MIGTTRASWSTTNTIKTFSTPAGKNTKHAGRKYEKIFLNKKLWLEVLDNFRNLVIHYFCRLHSILLLIRMSDLP